MGTMSELRECPFCQSHLQPFGHNMRDGMRVDIYKHPEGESYWGRCPLSGLVFDEARWNTRPIEDALTARANQAEKNYNDVVVSMGRIFKKCLEVLNAPVNILDPMKSENAIVAICEIARKVVEK